MVVFVLKLRQVLKMLKKALVMSTATGRLYVYKAGVIYAMLFITCATESVAHESGL